MATKTVTLSEAVGGTDAVATFRPPAYADNAAALLDTIGRILDVG